jgi:hypothetical protein
LSRRRSPHRARALCAARIPRGPEARRAARRLAPPPPSCASPGRLAARAAEPHCSRTAPRLAAELHCLRTAAGLLHVRRPPRHTDAFGARATPRRRQAAKPAPTPLKAPREARRPPPRPALPTALPRL